MNSLFAQISLVDFHQEVMRNIVSLGQSQDLFDDLSPHPAEWRLAQQVEEEIKPPLYVSPTPIIHRPFEDAHWFNAIHWPFKHWQNSRFSEGSYGVWYGCDSVETTVYESSYHWYCGLLSDAGFEHETVIAERKVYAVKCDAALLDFRPATAEHTGLLHRSDYSFTHSVGARLHHEGHPGLVIQSVRRPQGENVAIFNPAVLSAPKHHCQLTYRLENGRISVEKTPGKTWLKLKTENF